MSRRRIQLPAVLATITVVGLALAPFSAAAKPKPAKVQVRATGVGRVLVNAAGFTLYVFTHDKKNHDSCVQLSSCTGVWPVLKTNGRPVAGKGVKASLLGTVTLAHGVKQVTYAGHPLYHYVGDTSSGETDYVGQSQFGGTWYAINAAGKIVK